MVKGHIGRSLRAGILLFDALHRHSGFACTMRAFDADDAGIPVVFGG